MPMTLWDSAVVGRLSYTALICLALHSPGIHRRDGCSPLSACGFRSGHSTTVFPLVSSLIVFAESSLVGGKGVATRTSLGETQIAAPPDETSPSSGDILRVGFESSADRACPPVYASDGLTCMVPPPEGTWSAVSSSTVSYLHDRAQCHSGDWCGAMTLSPSTSQLNVMWDWVHTLPQQFYIQGWWKFPANWQWNTTDIDHKIIIFETDTPSKARMYLNLRTDTGNSQLAHVCVTTNAYIISHNAFVCSNQRKKDPGVRADGIWHSIQAYVDESGNQVQVWLDGALIISTNELGFDDRAPYKEIKFGAYMGGAAPAKNGGPRTFYVDDLCVSTAPCQTASNSGAAAQSIGESDAVRSGSN